MELSLLCGVKVFVFLHDSAETKIVQYQSHPNEDLRILFKRNINREFLSNEDVSTDQHKLIQYDKITSKRADRANAEAKEAASYAVEPSIALASEDEQIPNHHNMMHIAHQQRPNKPLSLGKRTNSEFTFRATPQ